jgi:hypothetical protein
MSDWESVDEETADLLRDIDDLSPTGDLARIYVRRSIERSYAAGARVERDRLRRLVVAVQRLCDDDAYDCEGPWSVDCTVYVNERAEWCSWCALRAELEAAERET